MKSKDYIFGLLEELHILFPSFTFRYQFDELDESHVIEYSPFDLTEGDIDFENKKYSILISYFEMNFGESLVFINELDPIGLSNPEKIYEGHFCYSPKDESLLIKEPNTINHNYDTGIYSGENNYSLAA